MQASVIAIKNHPVSQKAAAICMESSEKVNNNFIVYQHQATIPEEVDLKMQRYGLKWNYPWEGSTLDFATGLRKSAYRTANKRARIACSLSHYELWQKAASDSQPHLILEHDAKFIHTFDTALLSRTKFMIYGINDPLRATRKAREFKELVSKSEKEVCTVPWIDDMSIPQGLAGNSAYIITPDGAKKMLKLVDEYGLWPNDAIMCRQLIPQLGVTTKFYTQVQNTPSTTSDS